jgi:hypothetical protein
MNTTLITLALLVGQAEPLPRGGDRPLDTRSGPKIDGEWSIIQMELGGRPAPLRGDATATIEENVLTFPDVGNRVHRIRLELAPKNVLLASYPSSKERSPADPSRRTPAAEDNPDVKKTDPASTKKSPNTGDKPRDPGKKTGSSDPDGPDVGGPGGRPPEKPAAKGPRSEGNEVTERAPYNKGTYILATDYLVLQLKFPLEGPTETIGQRDRRPPEKGGSPSPIGEKTRGGTGDVRSPERDRDVGPDKTESQDLILILRKSNR